MATVKASRKEEMRRLAEAVLSDNFSEDALFYEGDKFIVERGLEQFPELELEVRNYVERNKNKILELYGQDAEAVFQTFLSDTPKFKELFLRYFQSKEMQQTA